MSFLNEQFNPLENLVNSVNYKKILLSDINEDPDQPREFFDNESLDELAQTIKLRGVKTPISVRIDPQGKYIINHGARRFRASQIAGLESIPAVIDNDYSSYDQIIENLQRDNLKPHEIAKFIQKMLELGEKKNQIAKKLGKSNSYVTLYTNLLTLPPALKVLYDSEKCQDVTVLNDLATLYKKNVVEVERWLDDPEQEVNRASLKYLKAYIESVGNTDDMLSRPATPLYSDLNDGLESATVKNDFENETDYQNDGEFDKNKSMLPETAVNDAKEQLKGQKKTSSKSLNVLVYSKVFKKEGVIVLTEKTERGRCFVQFNDQIEEVALNTLDLVSVE